MRILITGARAPVAIEWARIALYSGHQVWMADSMRSPLGRYLIGINGYLLLPSPRDNLPNYRQILAHYLKKYHIDMLIPTCEEIFYLSQLREQIHRPVNWLIPDKKLLFKLHNKFESMQFLQGLGVIKTPNTTLLEKVDDIVDDPATILKPVFSRFGNKVIRKVYKGVLPADALTRHRPWVQQQKLTGRAICNYALFSYGKLIAHQAYLPKYCLNQSAASYFEPYTDVRLDEFIVQFGIKTKFHGQVAFDFIEEDDQIYVIECNPRATSGLHLLNSRIKIQDI